jgi:hypothetical protein
MGREVLNPTLRPANNRPMPGIFARSTLFALSFIAATSAAAQTHHRRAPPSEEETPAPLAGDRRDTVVPASGAFSGRPYWLALAQCGGFYFKLNALYTDAAVHARVVNPDPRANAEFTRKLNDAIRIATTYFDASARFLAADRGLDRDNAVLTYDGQSRAAGDRVKTIDAGLAAAKTCPALYEACQEAFPKACSGRLTPLG